MSKPIDTDTAMRGLLYDMLRHDAVLNDDEMPHGSQAPTGDDYNLLFDLVLDAAGAAGLDYCVIKEECDAQQASRHHRFVDPGVA